MSQLQRALDIRAAIIAEHHDPQKVGDLLRRLPAAVRRMGLVRALEWLEVGDKAALGTRLFKEMATPLELPESIIQAVQQLETCPRRDLFRRHRLAVELFDDLAMATRVVEAQ